MYDELTHFGIKGMRWGVWNDETAQRYGGNSKKKEVVAKGVDRNERKEKQLAYANAALARGKDGKPSNAEKIANAAGDSISSMQNLANGTSAKAMRSVKTEYAEMSDEELRKKVNRLQMEQQYRNLRANDISSGKKNVDRILDIAGATIGIAGGAASIATAIYAIKKAT